MVLASLLLRGVDGVNLYQHARGNPVKLVDERGFKAENVKRFKSLPIKKKESEEGLPMDNSFQQAIINTSVERELTDPDDSGKLVKINFKELADLAERHIDFLKTDGIMIYRAAKEKGMTIHGALAAVAWSIKERGWNKSKNNNLFGLRLDGKTLSFPSPEAGYQAWEDLVDSKYEGAIELMKENNAINSDEFNYKLNSSFYHHKGSTYNNDADSSESTSIIRVSKSAGTRIKTPMKNYG